MSTVRRSCVIGLVVISSWSMTGCGGDPPNKELQQAQQAIDTARTSGAERYAKDEFTASQDALKRAQAAVVARDYRQALNDALDARDRAQTASKDTVDRKVAAKTDADHALHNAALAIIDARAKLRAAETSHRGSRPAAALRRDVTDAEKHVQEARTAFDNGDYLDALDVMSAPMQRLTDSAHALDAAAPPAIRRRR